jgi:LAO/AO transport system kinase
MRNILTTAELVAGVRARDRALLGRAITLLESTRQEHRERARELLRELLPLAGGSHRVGISGVPGVGKSTFISAFGARLIERGHRVAVLAVDPSSARTRGSILGDKTRMEELATSDDAFIRPSPAGGVLGGVAGATREAIVVCEAAGFDVVLVETVGVGQSETLVADMVDFFLVLLLAGGGDELQGIKRGILELADLLAITKADGANLQSARRARAEYDQALQLLRPDDGSTWRPRAVTCSAVEGAGLDEIWELVSEHRRRLEESGELEARRRRQRVHWMWAMVEERLRAALRGHPEVAAAVPALTRRVEDGAVSPSEAAEEILQAFGVESET